MDIQELADHLNISHFYVAGHSSGGPAALACAAFLPHPVLGVGLLSGDPEYAHSSAPNKKWVSRVCIGSCLPLMLEYVFCCLPMARHCSAGLRNDYRLDTSPYPFDVERDIRQPVLIYVGKEDAVLPVEFSKHVQDRLEVSLSCHRSQTNNANQQNHSVRLEIIPKIGHLGLLRDEVLGEFFESLILIGKTDSTPFESCVELV